MNPKHLKLTWICGILLAASALANAFFVFRQLRAYSEVEILNNKLTRDAQVAGLIQRSSQVQATTRGLVTDLAVYSQKQPVIADILLKHGVKVSLTPHKAP